MQQSQRPYYYAEGLDLLLRTHHSMASILQEYLVHHSRVQIYSRSTILSLHIYLYQMARPIRPLLGSVALLRRCKSKFFRSKKDEKFCQEHPRQQWKQCPLLIDSTHYKRILVYSSSCKVELNCKQNYFNEFIINLIVIYYNTILQMQPF